MVFNGHKIQDIDALDEATMNEIIVMYADGAIGNNSIVSTLGTLTTGVFNYMRASSSQSYNLKNILGNYYQYIDPDHEDYSASDSLLIFMSQSPGFNIGKFKGK